MYKHIDTSKKEICPTDKLLRSFIDSSYKGKMSKVEYIDYEKLIKESMGKMAIYSETYRNFN